MVSVVLGPGSVGVNVGVDVGSIIPVLLGLVSGWSFSKVTRKSPRPLLVQELSVKTIPF